MLIFRLLLKLFVITLNSVKNICQISTMSARSQKILILMVLLANLCHNVMGQCLENCTNCFQGMCLDERCKQNCLVCDKPQQICQICEEEYEINFFGICRPHVVQNCLLYDMNNLCYTCAPTFQSINGQCVKVYTGCKMINQMGSCTSCGFGLRQSGSKCSGIMNCQIYSSDQINCQKCYIGYQLRNNKCVDNQTGCATIRTKDGICDKCQRGYFMSGYRCIQNKYKTFRCLLFSYDNKCQQCKLGFVLSEGMCLLPKQNQFNIIIDNKTQAIDPNCEVYQLSSSICTRCILGYSLKNSKCEPISLFCLSYSAETSQCVVCMPNMKLINGQCIDQNCAAFQNGQCDQCLPGYQLQSNYTCKFADVNCLEEGSGRCRQCVNTHYLLISDGVCRLKPPGCQSVNFNTGECLECKNGYTLTFPDRQCLEQKDIENCQVKDPNNPSACFICVQRFYRSQGQCEAVSPLCNQYNPQTGECFQCFYPELSLSSGVCYDLNCLSTNNQGLCLQCKNNFQPSIDGKICHYNDQNCQTILSNKMGCLQCNEGYYLHINGSCTTIPQYCQSVSQTGQCLQCFPGYSFIANICQPSIQIPNCLRVNQATRICEQCIDGYFLENQQCKQQILNSDPNCLQFSNNRCVQCSNKFYVGQNGICIVVNALCKTNNNLGHCTSCFSNYILQDTLCVQASPISQDPYCLRRENNTCIQCSKKFYVGLEGKCIPVNPYCKDNNPRGQCTSCYLGYKLDQGRCIVFIPTDRNCKSFNGDICIQCYPGNYISNNQCVKVNPQCKTYNSVNGFCTSCYQGFGLNLDLGTCGNAAVNANCIQFKGERCLKCAVRHYLGAESKCERVDDLCQSFEPINGFCTSCYDGYDLVNGKCVILESKDRDCQKFNGDACISCYKGFYVKNGTCQKANQLCNTFNINTGACTSCYQGYILSGDLCIQNTNVEQNFCKIFNGQNCIQCYPGYISIAGKCQRQNQLCKTINKQTGQCLSCWIGYTLLRGTCQLTKTQLTNQNNIYCLEYRDNICTKCSSGFYLQKSTNICKLIDQYCQTYNPDTGECLSCFLGFLLTENKCIIFRQSEIPNCLTVDPLTGACQACIDGYFLSSSNKNCQAVSITCASFNKANGNCLTCIQGHYLQNGVCHLASIYDQNCKKYQSSYCSSCMEGYYIQSYRCKAIDPNCTRFDYVNKKCLQCRNNLSPSGLICI